MMWAFTLNVEEDGTDGYAIELDVNPNLMDQTDGKALIKKLAQDIINKIDDAPITEYED